MLILVLIFGALSFGLWRLQRGAKISEAAKSQELKDLRASLEGFRSTIQKQAADLLEKQLSIFRTEFGEVARKQALEQAQLEFDQWKAKHTQAEREDAIKKSRAVNRGLVAEQLAPHMAGFKFNPKDCSFLGRPCDYIVFDGLDAGVLKSIVFLEVKTGGSTMNARERQVRDAVQEARVSYEIYRLDTEV
jgi:predicted Holliday junction resolvase-like endonuclease